MNIVLTYITLIKMPKLTSFQSFFHMLYNIYFLQKNWKKKHTHNLRRRSLKQGKLPSAKKKKIYIYYSFTIIKSELMHDMSTLSMLS